MSSTATRTNNTCVTRHDPHRAHRGRTGPAHHPLTGISPRTQPAPARATQITTPKPTLYLDRISAYR
jgi:hypothetical protein